MAMKKKFLGLALAAAVALPATTAYAANDTQSIEMGKNDTKNVTVPISGTIRNKKGQAPEGRIEVELPTKMAFTVDEDGKLPNTTYTIQNRSQDVSIDVSVASFSGGSTATAGGSNGIRLHPSTEVSSNRSTKYRNEVELKLTNSQDPEKSVDLGNFKTLDESHRLLATVDSGQINSIVLSGVAGTKLSNDLVSDSTDVDSKGTSEDFNLVFSIKRHNI